MCVNGIKLSEKQAACALTIKDYTQQIAQITAKEFLFYLITSTEDDVTDIPQKTRQSVFAVYKF